MISEEILKLRLVFEETKAKLVRDINEAYSRGLPFYLINSIIEGFGYQLKPLMDEEVYKPPVQQPVPTMNEPQQVEVPETPVEEKGEQE